MKLIASGVANCAATTRSPSFSRSGASTTTTKRPWRMSSIASSTVANGVTSRRTLMWEIVARSPGEQALDVLREDVGLEVHGRAGTQLGERGRGERVRDERDLEAPLVDGGNGQRDTLDGDRALLDAVAEELGRRLDAQADAPALGICGGHAADAVHVALDVVAPERLAGLERRLDVHLGAGIERAERASPDRLGHGVEGDAPVGHVRRGQAAAVDRDGVARARAGGRSGRLDYELRTLGPTVPAQDPTPLSHDPGEHTAKATQPRASASSVSRTSISFWPRSAPSSARSSSTAAAWAVES